MRSPSFHFAMRSERAKLPTLSCCTPQPTARWTIETSSVSPERAETMAFMPAALAESQQASVSVTVPIWFGLSRTVLARPAATLSARVTNKSSPTTWMPAALVKARHAAWSFSAKGSSIETIG
jgi:hypothetical protein